MKPIWTSDRLIAALGGTDSGAISDISGVSIDTRTLQPGDLFVALTGDSRDGHAFVRAAFEKGAAAALINVAHHAELQNTGPVIAVEDTLDSLRHLGVAARERSSARICAVTGSVGKTGTKDALRTVLALQGEAHASVASYNNHFGVPLTLARMPETTRYGVFEIGMNHAGEITPLSKMVRPHVALVTTVEAVHLEFFDSVAGIADAKGEIFAGLEQGGTAVLNMDNPHFDKLVGHAKERAGRIVSFGAAEGADVRLVTLALDPEHSALEIDYLGKRMRYEYGSPGRHLALNSLAVLACVGALGADVDAAAGAFSAIKPPPGRGQKFRIGDGDDAITVIDESYNANPASMRAALAVLGAAATGKNGRRIAILGDMLELGPAAPTLHAEIAEAIEASGADLAFLCGPLMKNAWDALPVRIRGAYAGDSAALESQVTRALTSGDTLMIKGSLGSRMGRIVEAVKKQSAGT